MASFGRSLEWRWLVAADPIRVLFLCTHNSARSQMAEALLARIGGGRFDVFSAGTEATRVHPLAIRAMAEIGIDISRARSKHLDEFVGNDFDAVITVCDSANESCPVFPGTPQRIHWSFPDPSAVAGTEAERYCAFQRVRDAIARQLGTWVTSLEESAPVSRHG
jgi:arsenate reductase